MALQHNMVLKVKGSVILDHTLYKGQRVRDSKPWLKVKGLCKMIAVHETAF